MRSAYRLVIFVVPFLTAPPAGAQSRTFEQTVDFEPGSRFALESRAGSVRLSSWDESRVEIRARIEAPPGATPDAARAAVEGTTVEVRGNRRSLRVRSGYGHLPAGSEDGPVPLVHYEIRAPRFVDLELELEGSDTTMEGFEGRVLVDLEGGDLDATGLSGSVTILIDGGALRVSDLSGSVVLQIDQAERMRVESGSGAR